jgi:hypothetical protein
MPKTLDPEIQDVIRSNGVLVGTREEVEALLEQKGLLFDWLQVVRQVNSKYGLPTTAAEAAQRQQQINSEFLNVCQRQLSVDVIGAVDEAK